jgi:hypothetical protein
MREILKKTIILAAVGFVMGMLVGLGFLSITGVEAYRMQKGTGGLVRYLALSGLLGAVGMGGTTIYSLEHWSLLRCTVAHFAITLSAYCAVGFTLGWLDLRDPATPFMFLGYVIAYFIIWLAMCIKYKRQIRRINEALKTWKAHQDEKT